MSMSLPTLAMSIGIWISAVPLSAQSSPCRTSPDTAGLLISATRRIYSPADSAAIVGLGDPYASAADIQLVTDSTTCAEAVGAYNGSSDTAGGVTSLYVIALGANGFVVVNPNDTTGEFVMFYIFDCDWNLKRSLAG